MPRADRRATRVAVLAGTALLLSGCAAGDPTPAPTPTHVALETFAPGDTGTNGIEHLSGADVVTEAVGAVGRAAGAQFTFTSRLDGREVTVTTSAGPDGGTSTITADDGTLDLVVVDDQGFAQGTGDLAARYAVGAEYACRPLDDAVFDDWATMLDLGALLRTTTSGSGLRRGALNDGEPPTVEVILETDAGAVGSLVVTARGEPLPIRLVLADETGSLALDITGWAAAVVEAPTGC